MASQASKGYKLTTKAFGLLLLLPLLPLIAVIITFWFLYGLILSLFVWCFWCPRDQYVLFVYSDSPIWRDYIETNILPKLEENAIVLNWSQRSKWKRSLSTQTFRYFGGYRNFNPLAVVFYPFRIPRSFRFYKPFRDFKHGNVVPLNEVESELYNHLEKLGIHGLSERKDTSRH